MTGGSDLTLGLLAASLMAMVVAMLLVADLRMSETPHARAANRTCNRLGEPQIDPLKHIRCGLLLDQCALRRLHECAYPRRCRVALADLGQQGSKLHFQLHCFPIHRAKLFRRGGAN